MRWRNSFSYLRTPMMFCLSVWGQASVD
jgi:hypothetical protein